jgi:hypothetical protein
MTTYSNCFSTTPLTAAGIVATISDIMDRHGQRIDVKPDMMYLPVGFVEQRTHEAIVWCERLIRKLGERVATGTQAQRRRREAQGVVGRRHLRRLRLERDLVVALKDLHLWQSMAPDAPFDDETTRSPSDDQPFFDNTRGIEL